MRRPLPVAAAVLFAAGGLALSACGGSSSPSSSGSSNNGGSNNGGGGSSGGSFCQQAAAVVAQYAQIGSQINSQLENESPGATPDVTTFKQFLQSADTAIDGLDANAPSAISSAFHTLRQALDQATANLANVTTFDQLSTALAPLETDAVQSASTQVDNYMESTCGITPAPQST